MSDVPDIMVQNINLEAFERLIYARDGSPEGNEHIALQLLTVLGQVRRGCGFTDNSPERITRAYTRLAGAITTVLSDPKFGISWDGFLRFMSEHAQVHAIFRASTYDNMDHIIAIYGQRTAQAPDKMNFTGEQAISKMLMCWSLDSDIDVDFDAVAKASPQYAAAAIIGILSVGGSHSSKSYERRLMLMRMREVIASVPLPAALIQPLADCYMHCSYTDAPDKHEIKKTINAKMKEVVASLNIVETTRTLKRKERPTIVVPLEWFGSYHAMYRCYAPSMMQLRERFRMVAILRQSAEQPSIDDQAKEVFDKVVELTDATASISSFMEAIQREDPDILYYPSIGMSAWYVALSNFRLAPLQVMTPGHPASTMSGKIDYILSEGDLFGDESNYAEKCVHLPVGSVRYVEKEPMALPPVHGSTDGKLRVAISAMAVKIIPPFLQALKTIKERSPVPIEYHFFPNMIGLSHTVMEKDLHRWFPEAVVHPRAHYKTYLEWLSGCDVMFSTFPFGGTNSVIDCFILGIPVIAKEGTQILERSDASMMRRVGMPDWMIAHSTEGYVEAALRFVEGGEAERVKLRAYLQGVDVAKEFFGAPPSGLEGQFLAAFEKLYEENIVDDQARRAV